MNRTDHAKQLIPSVILLLLAILLSMVGVSGHALAHVACAYEIAHIIQAPSQTITVATGISPNGEYVVGFHGNGGNERSWVYRTATSQFTTIPLPGGISAATAEDVSDAGLAVGHMYGLGISVGFVFDLNTGQYVAQIGPTVAGGGASLSAINAHGVACGRRSISVNPIVDNAITWSAKGGVVDLGVMNGPNSGATDITDNGIVVGWTGGGLLITGTRGFLRQDGKLTIMDAIPGGLSSAAMASNDIPQVLLWGHYQSQPGGPNRSYLWEDGRMTDIGVLPGYQRSRACSINNSSIIVGLCNNPSGTVGYVWGAGVMQPLSDLVTDTTGFIQITAETINDGGQLPANGVTTAGFFVVGVVLLPVEGAPGDANCDQVVNLGDLLQVIGTWGPCEGCVTDFTGDETVNISDLLFVIQNWTVF